MATYPKYPKSYKLSEECARLIAELALKLGVNKTAVIEIAVRELAKEKAK